LGFSVFIFEEMMQKADKAGGEGREKAKKK
jgi:hypothetical protein